MSQDIFIAIQPITGNEVYITPDASTIEQVNVNVQPFSGDQVYINVQPDTGAQINVSVSPNMLGVYLVNGRDGAVTLDKSDVNLSNVENISITGTSGYLQNQINSLSGYVAEQEIISYTIELPSGEEFSFLPYPNVLSQSPSSVTSAFQNNVDNIIYNYTLGQITTSGFYINFSDVLTNSGYLLKIQVKK